MYFAFKYARKKYRERHQREEQQHETQSGQSPKAESRQAEDTGAGTASDTVQPVSDTAGPSTTGEEDNETPQETPAEKKARRKYRWKVLFGLVGPFTLQALDITIIASALPFIAQDFGEPHSLLPLPHS